MTFSDLAPPIAAALGLGAWLWAQFLGLRRDFADGIRRVHERVDALDRSVAKLDERTNGGGIDLRVRTVIVEAIAEHAGTCPGVDRKLGEV